MQIYLIGYMGSGKSTIAKNLARKLSYLFIDLDRYIEQQENATISDIFYYFNEDYFRELESKYLKELTATNSNSIIAVGGGTPCFNNNMDYMKSNGLTIYLQQSVDTLCSRLEKSKTVRPLIKGKTHLELIEYIVHSLKLREPFYQQANIIIDSPNKDANKIVEILERYKDYSCGCQ